MHQVPAICVVLSLRCNVWVQVLEKARQAKLLGSSLEAKVLLYVSDTSLRKSLQSWNQQPNNADPLRFMFIVSQVSPLSSFRVHEACCCMGGSSHCLLTHTGRKMTFAFNQCKCSRKH